MVEVVKQENITSFTNALNQQDQSGGWLFQIQDISKEKPTQISTLISITANPLHQKLGIIQTLFDRDRTLVSDKSDQQKEIDNVKETLRHCGYLDWTFKLVEDKQKEG